MQPHLVKVGVALPQVPGIKPSHVHASIVDLQTKALALRCANPVEAPTGIEPVEDLLGF
jgi:hypothetical protein